MRKGDRFVVAIFGGVLVLIGLLAATGWTLHGSYVSGGSPSTQNTLAIRDNPSLGFLADLHYWASFSLLITSGLLVAAMLWSGAFDKTRRWAWLSAIGAFLCAFWLQVTGNLLPMDAHDVQTVVIEGSVVSQAPVLGPTLKSWLLAGDQFSDRTVETWYWLHRWLLSIGVIGFAVVGLVTSRRQASDSGPRAVVWAPVILAAVLALALSAPTGAPAEEADATRYDARPSWYVLPLHGLLRLSEDYTGSAIGAFVVPVLFVAFALALPWVGHRLRLWIVRAVFLLGVAFATVASARHWEAVAPIAGPQVPLNAANGTNAPDPIQEIEPVDPAMAEAGRNLFNRLACAKCHGEDGAHAISGPKLTEVWRKQPHREWYIRFIRNPISVRPNSLMPGFNDLSQSELEQLAEFLRSPR